MFFQNRIIRLLTHNKILNPIKFSAWLGKVASKKFPSLIIVPFLRFFIRHFNIDITQYEIDINKVKTFNEFFTRKLKPGSRSFEGNFLSPADSVLTDFGTITDEIKLSVKGMECSMIDLFSGIEHSNFRSFAVFYLSPADYHRFHAPFDFEIEKIAYIPGKLHSVKPDKLDKYGDLYCMNRRVIIFGRSEYGNFALILVGALVVGRIVLNFFRIKGRKKFQIETFEKTIFKGEELGYFELGSTVILLMENDILNSVNISKGQHVLVGENLLAD